MDTDANAQVSRVPGTVEILDLIREMRAEPDDRVRFGMWWAGVILGLVVSEDEV